MNTPKFSRQDLKRQEKMSNARRNVLAFLIGVLFIAAMMLFGAALDVWGHEPHTDTVGDLNVGHRTPHWHWFPVGADNYADGMSHCQAQQMLCSAGEAETDRLKRYNPQGKAYWLVYCRSCGSHLGTGQYRYGGLIVSPTATATSTPTPTGTHTAMPTATPTATPTPTSEEVSPSTTPTGTATRGKGGPSLPGPRQSQSTATPTPTPTPTPTLLIIVPDSRGTPTPMPMATSGSFPPLTTEPKEGYSTPTATPRPFVSPCLVQHAGSPLNLCDSGDGWRMYFFGHDGAIRTGPYVPRWGGGRDGLFVATVNPLTGKPVLVQWIAEYRAVRVITYYDHHPYAAHKPYIFDIMPDDTVIHRVW